MESMFQSAIAAAFIGFVVGLAGKALAVKQGNLKKSEIFSRITVFSLVFMLLLAVAYQFIP